MSATSPAVGRHILRARTSRLTSELTQVRVQGSVLLGIYKEVDEIDVCRMLFMRDFLALYKVIVLTHTQPVVVCCLYDCNVTHLLTLHFPISSALP